MFLKFYNIKLVLIIMYINNPKQIVGYDWTSSSHQQFRLIIFGGH